MTQNERVLAAARSYRGVSAVDFQLPNVIDDGPPILRVAARVHDLEERGYRFERLPARNHCAVYRLIEAEGTVGVADQAPEAAETRRKAFTAPATANADGSLSPALRRGADPDAFLPGKGSHTPPRPVSVPSGGGQVSLFEVPAAKARPHWRPA